MGFPISMRSILYHLHQLGITIVMMGSTIFALWMSWRLMGVSIAHMSLVGMKAPTPVLFCLGIPSAIVAFVATLYISMYLAHIVEKGLTAPLADIFPACTRTQLLIINTTTLCAILLGVGIFTNWVVSLPYYKLF